jgi:hypothetical protein
VPEGKTALHVMKTYPKDIITTFPRLTLSTSDFKWLSEEGFEETHYRFLNENQFLTPLRLFAPFPSATGKGRGLYNPAKSQGTWILCDPFEEIRGFSQVQVIHTRFTRAYLIVNMPGFSGAQGFAALSFFVSGIFLLTGADQISILSGQKKLGEDMHQLGWGESLTLWSPNLNPYIARDGNDKPTAGGRWPVVRLDSSQWWDKEPGSCHFESLKYIQKRLSRPHRTARFKDRRPQRGLFSRMFGRKG